MYQVLHASSTRFEPVRGLSYHLRQWGSPQGRPLVLAHGWMDVAASWQFMVDAFSADFLQQHCVLAFDWRGFGLTRHPGTDCFWFPDYLADLDALLDRLFPDTAVDLVGHSMGGNVVMMYAGARAARIRRLVNLEGFGMAATRPAQAPARMAQWLDELKAQRPAKQELKPYPDLAAVAARLMKTNHRLPQDKADWLAHHWAEQGADGQWRILGDAAHKVVNPYLFRVDETLAMYSHITAPLLSVLASDHSLDSWWKGRYTLQEYHERLKSVPSVQTTTLDGTGHMLHHDQPQALASLIERFLA
jgi:pimeloyl-ACP methyl ester carboxylesterase